MRLKDAEGLHEAVQHLRATLVSPVQAPRSSV